MTPEQYAKRLKVLKDETLNIILNAPFAAAVDLQGVMMQRIFNKGEDAEGNDIGLYKDGPYKKKREKRGFRVDKVDQQFSGSLFASIKSGQGEEEGTGVVGFNSLKEGKIARYNELRYDKPIYKPSLKEQEDARDFMLNFVRDSLREKVRTVMNGQ